MYDLHLTPEQLEFRDTVRDFVENEIKPVALHPDRLQPFEKPLLTELVDKASQMGLRTFALSEDAGGAGADDLTSCIVLEELAAGEVDIATVLGHTSFLGHVLFDQLLSAEQRARFLPKFAEDDRYHLAFAGREPNAGAGWSYHRALAEGGAELSAKRQTEGNWVINGSLPFVANAPIAKLLVVQARSDPKKTGANGMSMLLVPSDAKGLTIGNPPKATGEAVRWHQGTGASVTFKDCRVPGDHLVGKEGQSPLADGTLLARSVTQMAAINLGLGRAAYDAAVDYAKIRRQGGRNIIEHQAIGSKLADCAIKLELARNMIWKAAWAADHPDAVSDRSLPELPLHTMARVYTARAVNEVTLLSAECFGAMGVMRDMPLQKYVHDGFVFAHADETDDAAKLTIAEALAGYERPLAA
ncbi:MAG: acyl-CoA dehydrogenase family protein [Betaproteobacteria bacterium]|jgi:alkylation response protein AidB-like acyl-CoA dehydrogenase|nr:MAG: acyl-CoA dehydrogenase family protein [Betaproteobacteria bacterium]